MVGGLVVMVVVVEGYGVGRGTGRGGAVRTVGVGPTAIEGAARAGTSSGKGRSPHHRGGPGKQRGFAGRLFAGAEVEGRRGHVWVVVGAAGAGPPWGRAVDGGEQVVGGGCRGHHPRGRPISRGGARGSAPWKSDRVRRRALARPGIPRRVATAACGVSAPCRNQKHKEGSATRLRRGGASSNPRVGLKQRAPRRQPPAGQWGDDALVRRWARPIVCGACRRVEGKSGSVGALRQLHQNPRRAAHEAVRGGW
jgi:hypothetical protein